MEHYNIYNCVFVPFCNSTEELLDIMGASWFHSHWCVGFFPTIFLPLLTKKQCIKLVLLDVSLTLKSQFLYIILCEVNWLQHSKVAWYQPVSFMKVCQVGCCSLLKAFKYTIIQKYWLFFYTLHANIQAVPNTRI